MEYVSNLKRVEAIVVRPFTGADNIVRNVGDRFITTAGRLKNYANKRNGKGKLRPLAVLYEPDEKQESQEPDENETVELKAVDGAPENKALATYENKAAKEEKPKKKRGRPRGSKNKKRR
jgi:hypothetical protein